MGGPQRFSTTCLPPYWDRLSLPLVRRCHDTPSGGIFDSTIKVIGRWKSDAFIIYLQGQVLFIYIRPHPHHERNDMVPELGKNTSLKIFPPSLSPYFPIKFSSVVVPVSVWALLHYQTFYYHPSVPASMDTSTFPPPTLSLLFPSLWVTDPLSPWASTRGLVF